MSLMAENTGRSGQPVQKLGGRGSGTSTGRDRSRRALCASMSMAAPPIASASSAAGCASATKAASAAEQHVRRCIRRPCGSRPLPCTRRLDVGAAQLDVAICLLDVLGLAFLHHQHGALAERRTSRSSLGHQRIGDVEHQDRDCALAVGVGQAELLQARAAALLVEPALHDDADVGLSARRRMQLVELRARG